MGPRGMAQHNTCRTTLCLCVCVYRWWWFTRVQDIDSGVQQLLTSCIMWTLGLPVADIHLWVQLVGGAEQQQ
jgi:hypothetical protein